jgi:signal transduction histidine kinase/ActR/RegA family two-component response regulator
LDIDTEIRRARLHSVFERLRGTSLITIANAALMTAVLAEAGASKGPWIWLTLIGALAATRLMSLRAYHRRAQGAINLRAWEVITILGALLSGTLWGGGAVLLFPADETTQLLWVFVIGGMCAGAASFHAAHLPTALAFIGPAALPLVVLLAIQNSPQKIAAAAMLMIFIMALTFTARGFNRHFEQTLRLRFELDDTNQRLRKEIEDHRSTEQHLRQAQKMEAVGQLTGGIAHDFNNLLTVITGSLELILRHAAGHEAITRLATAAEHAAERGARLTASLLSFARKQPLSPEPLDINTLIREFTPLLRRAVGEIIQLEVDLASSVPETNTDAAHCQSALLNLVINARDAMPAGGRLTIATQTVTLSASELTSNPDARPGEFVAMAVRDSGSGMTPDVVARAFDPFFTTKDLGKGSGLGLSQVYGFVRQSGGHVAIESRLGEGTSVSIFLPADVSPAGTLFNQPAAHSAAIPRTVRVLLVEDNAEVRTTLLETLSSDHWDAIAVSAGEAALAVLQQDENIGILVTDIAMGAGMSGIDLAHTAVARRPDLSVILMSGYLSLPAGSQATAGHRFEVLQKPFTGAQLAARMRVAWAARSTADHNREADRG